MTLDWTLIRFGLADLYRTPLLLSGDRDALLIDGSFTQSAGRRQIEVVRESGKTLRAIIVTCADPDYYFSLGTVRAAFPDVPILAPPEIAAKIADTAAHKVEVWREQLGDDGPGSVDGLALPQPWTEPVLTLEGESIEIVTTQQPGHYHLWLESRRAILGGVQISSGNHIWMADTPLASQRAAWLASLDAMLARNPAHAPPGHMPPGASEGVPAIQFTQAYVRDFEHEMAVAGNSASLIAAMTRRYPDLAMAFILDLGARVCMGEQPWP